MAFFGTVCPAVTRESRGAAGPTVGTSGEIPWRHHDVSSALDLLSVFAATSAAWPTSTSSNSSADGVTDFPGEQPTDKELSDWLDLVGPNIRRIYGAALRGDVPAHLVKLKHGADDLTDFKGAAPACRAHRDVANLVP